MERLRRRRYELNQQIIVRNLCKVYRIHQREAGLSAAVRSLIHRQYRDVLAVDHISFTVQSAEIVGFSGPNGAGKTTTLKMLSGLLYSTSGEARVAGFIPWERKPDYLRQISMVMGNKHQLVWSNTAMDSFYVLGEIYRVPRDEFRRTVDELVDLLEIEDLLSKLVRNLSLGERMKCELVAALLHRPRVLFLDEPTIGLDITMQVRLRRFIAGYNQQNGTTVILTSHYMADVVSLCPRIILIHKGQLLYDGRLTELVEKMAPFKLIRIAVGEGVPLEGVKSTLSTLVQPTSIVEQNERQFTLRVKKSDVSAITASLLSDLPVADLAVENPPVEAVIDQVYREGMAL